MVLSPETAYATKDNIKFPGTTAQAKAASLRADTRIEDAIPGTTVTIEVPETTIQIAT